MALKLADRCLGPPGLCSWYALDMPMVRRAHADTGLLMPDSPQLLELQMQRIHCSQLRFCFRRRHVAWWKEVYLLGTPCEQEGRAVPRDYYSRELDFKLKTADKEECGAAMSIGWWEVVSVQRPLGEDLGKLVLYQVLAIQPAGPPHIGCQWGCPRVVGRASPTVTVLPCFFSVCPQRCL